MVVVVVGWWPRCTGVPDVAREMMTILGETVGPARGPKDLKDLKDQTAWETGKKINQRRRSTHYPLPTTHYVPTTH